jgi:glyoxylase-like metal-dependent hydrolase (beta-lactamase superfamily II)
MASKELGNGIFCIDTGYQRSGFAACYLVRSGNQAAIIDTGTMHTLPAILELMDQLGLGREALKYVMPTHVHLDHAGCVGHLMAAFPEAQLVVHPFGARHMIDPAKLTAGATTVYGEEKFRADFGELVPVPADRVLEAEDGFALELNGRPLVCLDTPGHARHHYCVHDDTTKAFFTGDTFGISYREFDSGGRPFIFPPSTPVQFDPDAWHKTLEQLISYSPERMYLAHYGMVEHPERLADELHLNLDAYVEIALSAMGEDRLQQLKQGLNDWYYRQLKLHGCDLSPARIDELLALDLDLNAQGLEVWLQRREKQSPTST